MKTVSFDCCSAAMVAPAAARSPAPRCAAPAKREDGSCNPIKNALDKLQCSGGGANAQLRTLVRLVDRGIAAAIDNSIRRCQTTMQCWSGVLTLQFWTVLALHRLKAAAAARVASRDSETIRLRKL